jgi:hypothetical protein
MCHSLNRWFERDQPAADEQALRSAQLVRDRLAAGAPTDDRITREALDELSRELREFAEEVQQPVGSR